MFLQINIEYIFLFQNSRQKLPQTSIYLSGFIFLYKVWTSSTVIGRILKLKIPEKEYKDLLFALCSHTRGLGEMMEDSHIVFKDAPRTGQVTKPMKPGDIKGKSYSYKK